MNYIPPNVTQKPLTRTRHAEHEKGPAVGDCQALSGHVVGIGNNRPLIAALAAGYRDTLAMPWEVDGYGRGRGCGLFR